MSDQRHDARELLRELMSELLASNGNGNGNGGGVAPVPQVPPPPVAAVHRPSTWTGPPAPGEVVGDGARVVRTTDAAEQVTIDSNEDLDRFVRALAKRLDNPAEREAIRTGKTRFMLARPAAKTSPSQTIRIEKGAVTERLIREAAANGQRLVLARGAVLTPLARDQARKLRVHIEKEHS